MDDAVYVQDAESWFSFWGVDPEDDPGKRRVRIEDLRAIHESPIRLPAELATRVYRAGESGMGCFRFDVVPADDRIVHCATGDAVDLIDWPDDIDPRTIVGVGTRARAIDTGRHAGSAHYAMHGACTTTLDRRRRRGP